MLIIPCGIMQMNFVATCLGSSSEDLNRGELVPDVQGPGGQPIGRRAIWSVGGAESLL